MLAGAVAAAAASVLVLTVDMLLSLLPADASLMRACCARLSAWWMQDLDRLMVPAEASVLGCCVTCSSHCTALAADALAWNRDRVESRDLACGDRASLRASCCILAGAGMAACMDKGTQDRSVDPGEPWLAALRLCVCCSVSLSKSQIRLSTKAANTA